MILFYQILSIFLLAKRLNQELTQKNNPKLAIENYIKNNQEF